MKRSYNEFFNFVQCFDLGICDLWQKYNEDIKCEVGDTFRINIPSADNPYFAVFEGCELDGDFNNGTAFYYIFHATTNEKTKYKLRSINKVDDPRKLTEQDKQDLFSFWVYCERVD